MNSNPQNHPESPVPSSEPSTSNLQPSTFAGYRGNGKVARLPKPVRDQINQWMLDGVSYPDIIERLGQHGKDLNPGHLCEWKKRGHQDWLLEQAWLAQTRARQEPGVTLSGDFDATQLNHAALQLGTLHMFEALRDLNSPRPSNGRGANGADSGNGEDQGEAESVPIPSPRGEGQGEGEQIAPQAPVSQIEIQKSKFKNQRSALDLRLGGDSSAFVRLMNALARASRETMLVQKYREACARARAALTQLKDPNRKLNESETRAIVREVDNILGLQSVDEEGTEESTVHSPQSTVHSPGSTAGEGGGNNQ